MFTVLVTCPPMIQRIREYKNICEQYNFKLICPTFTQTLTEEELIHLVPKYDAWIIGDDPATRKVFQAGVKGNLKVAIKWGVGVDNVDFEACKEFGIPITNTPNSFGEEVSDIAIGYLLSLTRQIHIIDSEVKKGNWYKPSGISLSNKKVALVGFGDIGRCIAKKLLAFNLNVYVSDPACSKVNGKITYNYGHGFNSYSKELTKLLNKINEVNIDTLEKCVNNADFIFISCALNKHTKGMINKDIMLLANKDVIVINVARGPIIVEKDVIELLNSGHIKSIGFDVFENEPLKLNNPLIKFKNCIFGSHNASNTVEAVDKVSHKTLQYIHSFFK